MEEAFWPGQHIGSCLGVVVCMHLFACTGMDFSKRLLALALTSWEDSNGLFLA